MNTIDLGAIIKAKDLDVATVAQQLFPTNQYSRLALNRVIAGKAELDAVQMRKLASMANMTIDELYNNGGWVANSKDGIHTFTNGEFIAELNTSTWITKVWHNNSMIHESVIHAKDIPLSQYLEALNKVTLNIQTT